MSSKVIMADQMNILESYEHINYPDLPSNWEEKLNQKLKDSHNKNRYVRDWNISSISLSIVAINIVLALSILLRKEAADKTEEYHVITSFLIQTTSSSY